MLFLSCYKFRDDYNIEFAYMEFCKRIGAIERASYDVAMGLTEVLICFSTRKSFRHQILDTYKANRERNATEETKVLSDRVRTLKRLIFERLKPMIRASNVFEADDLVVQYADKGYLVASIDKDVINASQTMCFDYKNNKWLDAKDEVDIRRWYIMQSIMGDSSDGISGVKGMGKVKAEKFVTRLFDGEAKADDYVELFETPEHCLMLNRLVRMNQYDSKGKLKLISMEEVLDSIYPF